MQERTGLETVLVWDPLVRIGHWVIVAGFTIAYFTEDELLSAHVWGGYVVGIAIAMRVLWGSVGPKHARFADFVYGPSTVISYLFDLLRFRPKRYIGHSPAGSAMIFALLVCLVATVVTGLAVYGAEKRQARCGLYTRRKCQQPHSVWRSRQRGPMKRAKTWIGGARGKKAE